jgi:PhnB protein
MAVTMANPYLFFNGTAEKALELYKKALGATVAGDVSKFGDAPGTDPADAMANQPAASGGNVHVCLNLTDVDDMAKKFDALAAGGTVTMPLADTFWGARFGTLTDAFGVQWMFNCELKK